jgi:hypothetical protein
MQLDDGFGIAAGRAREDRPAGTLTLDFDTFAWSALADESAALGVSIDELARFSVLYYVSDRDSGRIARRLPPDARRVDTERAERAEPLTAVLSAR